MHVLLTAMNWYYYCMVFGVLIIKHLHLQCFYLHSFRPNVSAYIKSYENWNSSNYKWTSQVFFINNGVTTIIYV